MKTDLLERLRAKAKAQIKAPGTPCGVCSLPKETLEAIRQLKAEGIANTVLARTLVDEGFQIRRTSVSNHFLDHEPRG